MDEKPAVNGVDSPLKIDIVVHGRFHAFALASGLLALGHDVIVLTNYPPSVVESFGFPGHRVRSFLVHGVTSRIANRLERKLPKDWLDRRLHTLFGRWVARNVRADTDVVHGFSGVMEEYLSTPRSKPSQVRTIVRGSAHIEEQSRLLEEEEARAGVPIDKPSGWMRSREAREYAMADKIVVLSSFAFRSFCERGFTDDRLVIVSLGVDTRQFGASQELINRRRQRLQEGQALRVLNVGTFSFQKGMYDLLETASRLQGRMLFRFVGTVPPEAKTLLTQASEVIELVNRVPENELRQHYEWADVFVFPTIQDGFAAVLLQAAAAGLPIIATTNCSAPDFVREGITGWIVPIRDPDALSSRLIWCDNNRKPLAQAAQAAADGTYIRDWKTVASDLIKALM